ncbi:TIGR02680 family protein [Rhodococcus rhodochrous]|uniref:Endonuclease n=1 Tax=Rhodococcus rhodochrous KG-21 TaxID=1441923 RepID=A0A0M9WMZ4_RHORH|nr:TIGR02680 family protein [Rhodococcus rhodochrous]KOS55040.1 endonuclease [Rhodococcus rhodochrous KG-21]
MSSARFRPTRAGIINLWDYRDQEFSFADGRLVLRGPNGSGKTKALEVLFPFVFDGRIEPRRLNPFAGEERTMRSNLLYQGQDSAYSYVWMEFCRGRRDDPEAVTVGVGMRAARGNDKVTRWYFVVDGRVGVDFSLLDEADRPLTRRQLIEEVGADTVTDRPVDYRAAIDARLFGLGIERYEQLINLILTLRRPQLAKNLDPKGLSQALTDGLRPLDEQLVLEAARSFADMEEVSRTLESLAAADDAAQRFVAVYTTYLGQQARADVDRLGARLAAVDAGTSEWTASVAEFDRAGAERALTLERLEVAERDLEQARATLEALQRSSAYEGKQQLDDLAQVVADLERTTAGQAEQAQRAQAELAQREEEARRAAEAAVDAAAAAHRAEDALAAAARDAGIEWTVPAEDTRGEQIAARVAACAEERAADVRAVRTAVAAADGASAARVRAEAAAERARAQLESARMAVDAADAAVESARAEASNLLREWWTGHRHAWSAVDGPEELFEALGAAIAAAGDDEAATPAAVLAERTAPMVEELRFRRRGLDAEITDEQERIALLQAERDMIEAERDDAPPAFPASTTPTGTPGAPLWRLVRFADAVSAEAAAGLEAALEAANLLTGWVCGAAEDAPAGTAVLVPAPPAQRPAGRTLADVLVVEPDTGVPAERVREVLASVAVPDAVTDETGPGVDERGGYRQGVQLGRHTKAQAEYIGATARARRRHLRSSELEAEIAAGRARMADAESARVAVGERLARLDRAASAVPRTGAVLAALRKVSECAGALRTAGEAAAAADRDLDQVIAECSVKERQVRSVAARHRAPHTTRELEQLAAAIRFFESQGQAVLRTRREQVAAAERAREAQVRRDDTRAAAGASAERAVTAEESLRQQQQRLATLREALGADAQQIDAQLAQARERIEAARTEQRAARRAHDDAVEQLGKAEAAHAAAEQALRSALTETRVDAAQLAPYARPDVLALLGISEELRWPSAAVEWPAPEQARLTRAAGDVPAVPAAVGALYAALAAATATVKGGDGARKAARSALTAALQEFDGQLAAAGQDYRLQWDAPEGLTVVRVQDEQGFSSVAEFAVRIGAARREQELLLTDAERRILEDALLAGLAQQIHERTEDARELIARMGTEMRQRRMSSGTTVGVRWVLADHLDDQARAVCRLLDREVSALGPEELARVRAHFAARIRAERAAHPEWSYPEILATTLDYRRWRVFSFGLIGADGTEDRLTVARHSALSGGEQSVSLHLPLFAAAHVMLDSADPQAPRLLALDEAFAGVDDNGRAELLGLSVQFDLDLFMTGYDLWITYAGVPACAHYDLAHSVAEHTVGATLLVWSEGGLLAEHDGSDLAAALGSPGTRRVPAVVEGALEFA